MEDKNPIEIMKEKLINVTKQTLKEMGSIFKKIMKPIFIKTGILLAMIIALALFVWGVEEKLFDVASSGSGIFNKPGITYIDEETEEEIPLIRINDDETMWVIPEKAVDYIREQIMKTSDIIRLNLADGIDSITDLESEENKQKLNKYIREFLKAEQATYYPNLDVE